MSARIRGKVTFTFTVDVQGFTGDEFHYLPDYEQEELIMEELSTHRGGMALDADHDKIEIDEIKDLVR